MRVGMGRAPSRREIVMEASAREETVTAVEKGGGPAKQHSGGHRGSSSRGGGGEERRRVMGESGLGALRQGGKPPWRQAPERRS